MYNHIIMNKLKFLLPHHFLRLLYINFRYNGMLDRRRLILMDGDVELKLGKNSKISIPKGGRLDFGNIVHEFSHRSNTKLILEENATFSLEEDWTIVDKGCVVYVGKGKNLSVGSQTYISSNVKILAHDNISIGKNCMIASGVQIFAGDGHPIYQNGACINPDAPVVLEDNVWLGSRALILKGVTVGKGSIVAAGAVVTKDVPPHSIAAGNPSKIIKQDISWKESA